MKLYFSFILIFLIELSWPGVCIFIKIFCEQQNITQAFLKSSANNQHLKRDNSLNLPCWQSVTNQIDTQNHISINTKPDYEIGCDKMFCHPLKSLITTYSPGRLNWMI